MMFRSSRSFFSSSSKDFLSEIDPLVIRPKSLTGLEWMEGIKDVKSDGSLGEKSSVHRPSFNDNYALIFVIPKSKGCPL